MKKWTHREKIVVDEEFEDYIKSKKMPTKKILEEFIKRTDLNRNLGQIKGYLYNLIKKR